jgi:transposase
MSTSLAKRPFHNVPEDRREQIAQELLAGYAQGDEVAEMAKKYGVSDVTAYALLIRDHEGEWKQAQESRAVVRRDKATKDLQSLREQLWKAEGSIEEQKQPLDLLSLARIREQVKLAEIQAKRAEWELERVFKRIYGQDAGPAAGSGLHISLNFGTNQTQANVVDAEVIDETKR